MFAVGDRVMSMSHSSVPSEGENEVSSTHTLASTEADSVTVMSAGEKDAIATACVFGGGGVFELP